MCVARKASVLVGLALVVNLSPVGSPEVRASGTVAKLKEVVVLSPMGAKALNKAVTWGAITLFPISAFTGNVLAKNSDMLHPAEQVMQAQSPTVAEQKVSIRIPLYDAVSRLDYLQLKELLEA